MKTWYGGKEKRANLQRLAFVRTEEQDISVADYFKNLSLLKYVPMHYLTADKSWLEKETLLFFHIDPQWIECLLEGARSIGRDTAAERLRDGILKKQLKDSGAAVQTGFILYSDIIKCWPGIKIRCQGEDGRDLRFLRLEGLAGNMLIGIVEGEIRRIVFHQPEESLHEGFEAKEGEMLVKNLKNISVNAAGDKPVQVKIRRASNRVIDIRQLKGEMEKILGKKLGPAEFGLQMAASPQVYTIDIEQK